LADGDWNYTDVFNLLGLVPFAVPAITSAKKSLGTFRALQIANVADDVAESADDVIWASGTTEVEVANSGGHIQQRTPNPFLSQSDDQLLKSQRSFEDLIREHQQKLDDYLRDPDAFDNKGLLRVASPEIREKIIQGRTNALRKQLRKQQGELEKIQEALRERGIGS